MNMNSYYGKAGILHSPKAEDGARKLFTKLENDAIKMDILPNQYSRFTGDLEEADYISYGRFLKSVNGQKVLKMLEEQNARNVVEL